jgi:hypothetical protein
VNPCRATIEVRFGQYETVDDPSWERRIPTRIPPLTTQIVKSAFADVGPDEYSVLVAVKGTKSLIRVADVWGNDPCPSLGFALLIVLANPISGAEEVPSWCARVRECT